MEFRFLPIVGALCMMMVPSSPKAAEAWLVADQATGHVLDAKEAETPRQVASLVKIAAALVVLEWVEANGGDPTAHSVVVPREALRGGANPLGLREGDDVPVDTALYAAMMASDNTSTYALAEAIGRRMEATGDSGVTVFVARMNGLATRLGMARTRFVNPHGLDEGTDFGVSTASDIARLAIHAHDRPDFLRYASEKERNVSFRREGRRVEIRLVNTNELVGSRGIDGMKTGTTRRSGPCLVVTATRDLQIGGDLVNRRLVGVVLDSEDRFREAVLLLDRAWPACASWLGSGGGVDPKQRLRKEKD